MTQAEPNSPRHLSAYAPGYGDDDEGGLDLGQVLATLRRRALLIIGVTTVVSGAAVYKALTDTPIYTAGFEILTEPVTVETQVISAVNPETLSGQEEIVAVEVDAVKLKLLKSPTVIDPVLEELSNKYPGVTYGEIVSNLTIKSSADNLLTVSYQSPKREFTMDVLNQLEAAYLDYSLEARQADILKGIKFVNEQIPQLKARVDEQQLRLQELRQKYNLVDPDSKGTTLSTQVSSVEQQRLELDLQLNEARSLYAALQRELENAPTEVAASSILLESPRYQDLLTQLRTLDQQIAQESVLYLERSPELTILQEQRERLLPLLREEGNQVVRNLATQIRELEARNQILDETVVELNQEVKQLSVVSREYSDIQRELGITTKNLEQFLSRREAFKIDIAQQETPWQLITPTGTPKPAAASAKKNLVLGSVLGLLLGTGAALLFDKLSNNLYTPKDLKELTRLPLLGIIPWNKNLESAALDHRPALENLYQESRETTFDSILSSSSPLSKSKLSPAFYEAFRSLYTNIRLLSPDAAIRSLTVTSAMPLEGKTTIATYLAQAAADQGRRVLLVDADLRSPSIHQQMGLTNGMGLTDVVLADTDFNHVIQQSSSNTHLFILTAGLAPPDPVRILSSQKMAEVMDKLQETFDLVIYDSAPLSGLADTYLLAAETNGVVLTAGLGTVKRSILENVMGDLQQHPNFRVPLLGVVANRAQNVSQNLYDYNYYTQESPWRPSPGNDDSHDTPSNGQVAAEVGQKKPNKSLLGRFRKS